MLEGPFTVFILFGGLTFLLLWTFRKRPKVELPPGPKGLPIVGSFFEIPSDHYWLKFDEWVQKFGPICSFTTFGKTIILVGSPKVAADLLDRRSAIYSGRPRWVFASEMLAKNMHVGTIDAGDKHRRFRKAIHAGLQPKAIASYHPIEEREARAFLNDVYKNPEDFRNCIKRYTAAVILGTMYGHQVTTFDNDRFAKRVFKSASRFAGSLAPGAFMVDILPSLRYLPSWVPGTSWQKKAKEWAEDDQNLYFELREAARANHPIQPSFISEGLNEAPYGVSEEELAYIGGTISQTPDTLMAVTSGFMLAMTKWPEIQQRAQAEIDTVVGRGRFPTFSDRAALPYTVALVKEVCRWRPVAPLSVPHASTQDDEYMGYFIPKGTTVISSIWSIHRDKDVYAEPEIFNPDRFLDDNGREKNTEESKVLGHHLYGFGRRLCPGATMADHAIWVFVAHVLWGLNIRPLCNEQGQEISPAVDPLSFTSGGEASHPRPFKCHIGLREGVQEMLDDLYDHELNVSSE